MVINSWIFCVHFSCNLLSLTNKGNGTTILSQLSTYKYCYWKTISLPRTTFDDIDRNSSGPSRHNCIRICTVYVQTYVINVRVTATWEYPVAVTWRRAATASIVFSFCLIPSAAVVNRVQHIGGLGQRSSYRNNIIIYRRVDCRRRRRRERRETCSR